ncbi:polysaccharide deacetylase family protein [Paenibacillus thermotolerans]|uniref:polysaccharide deacetylase family protein n=1 Tax=Paenibacillus thermotolerans TaxID=3027807 RepID=UPI00236867B5|nr:MULTISPECIES: polysaccharide deacetylase family protein [unclassified Paenibacillus]
MKAGLQMNALTVDVEEYFHANLLNIPASDWGNYESSVEVNTRRLLDCFDRFGVKATFFIVGWVASEYPLLVKEIAERGHEIGSHSGRHRLLTELDANRFREDIRSSKQLLEDISGQEIYQYRAPSWSLGESRYEWFSILEEEGYRIDSSLLPFKTTIGGSYRAPYRPFRPVVGERKHSIVEFPATVWKQGPIRFPLAGGFYLRSLPITLTAFLLERINRERPGMVYVHPWEMDPN